VTQKLHTLPFNKVIERKSDSDVIHKERCELRRIEFFRFKLKMSTVLLFAGSIVLSQIKL